MLHCIRDCCDCGEHVWSHGKSLCLQEATIATSPSAVGTGRPDHLSPMAPDAQVLAFPRWRLPCGGNHSIDIRWSSRLAPRLGVNPTDFLANHQPAPQPGRPLADALFGSPERYSVELLRNNALIADSDYPLWCITVAVNGLAEGGTAVALHQRCLRGLVDCGAVAARRGDSWCCRSQRYRRTGPRRLEPAARSAHL